MYDDYNTIQNHQYIPKQAFLYFPQGDSTKRQEDDFKLIFAKNQLKRLIYEGNIEYLDQENLIIANFVKYLEDKQIKINKQWSKAYIYKFLQSTGYDYKKTMKQMIAHNQYKANLKQKNFQDLKKSAEQILNKGTFYFNGRDAKFRPIIVADIKKIHQLKLKQEEIYLTLQYFFEFLYRNMFINGQSQNVIGIIDVGGTSPFDLIQPMKMTISFLQGNYKYKLHVIYVVRSTGMFKFAYTIAKQFMKEDTIRKINIMNNDIVQPLLQFCSPNQLQKKFGGLHPNLRQGEFWPPKQFSQDYSHTKLKTNFVTQEEYRKMYKQGLLPARKICLDFVKDENDSQQPPTHNNHSVSIKLITKQTQNLKPKQSQNVFKRFFQKINCKTCLVHQHKNKRSFRAI